MTSTKRKNIKAIFTTKKKKKLYFEVTIVLPLRNETGK